MSETRKIAAILVADVVGYSRLVLNPSFTVSRARINWTAMSDDPAQPVQLAPIFEALREAGLPEQ
jgi:hypothetical protein